MIFMSCLPLISVRLKAKRSGSTKSFLIVFVFLCENGLHKRLKFVLISAGIDSRVQEVWD